MPSDQQAAPAKADDEAPTPYGYLRYAEEYRLAAETVIGNNKTVMHPLMMPAYNLIAQSIELSLKAYLLSKGLAEKELRSKAYGHHLGIALREAERRSLGELVALDDVNRHVIDTLSAHYEKHEFRYIKVGVKTVPYWSEIGGVAQKLTDGLYDYCLILRIGQEAASQRIASVGRWAPLRGVAQQEVLPSPSQRPPSDADFNA